VPTVGSGFGLSPTRNRQLRSLPRPLYLAWAIATSTVPAANVFANPRTRWAELTNSVVTILRKTIHRRRSFPFCAPAARRPNTAGLKRAIERGWLWMHESGAYAKFMPDGADLFA
jgi:hypothetical protein